MRQREFPEINAGSVADIAFLLLIFFLVTTTLEVDKGIFTKLPKKTLNTTIKVKDKNILEILINNKNELMVEGNPLKINELTQIVSQFIDNGSGKDIRGKGCDWCNGIKDPASSDHPTKAVIAITASKNAHYESYIRVLDNVQAAYANLRNDYALKTYNISYTNLLKSQKKETEDNHLIKDKIFSIQKKYPLLITDSQIVN